MVFMIRLMEEYQCDWNKKLDRFILITDVTQNVKHPRFQRIFFGEYF